MATGIFQTVIVGFIASLISVLISLPLWLIYTGVIQVGGLTDNPAVLGILGLAILPLGLWIAGFAAQQAVRLGK
jgi:magnesium-transporting ATPase (P-type)